MEEWKEYKLGELCEISSSKRIFAKEYKEDGIPFYRGKEIIEKHNGVEVSDKLYISIEKYLEIKEKYGVPCKGDLLLTSVGTLGVPCIVDDKPFYFKDGNLTWFYSFRGIKNLFLYYWIESPLGKEQIYSKAIGSTQKALTIDALSKFSIKIPSIEVQDKIVFILKSLDDKIDNNRKINSNLEQQAKAIFKSWFIDFEPFKDGKFVESELGMIPEGWEVMNLGEVCEVIGGGTPSKSNLQYYTKTGIHWITPKDLSVSHAKFTSKGADDITLLGYNNSSAKLMPKGSVLFSSRAPIGYISIALNELCTNQGFKSVVPNRLGTAYVYYYLSNHVKDIEAKASGSTFKEASGSLMKSLKIIVPTKVIISEFDKIMNPIFHYQSTLESESNKLSSLRDTLLPKLMSGELKV